MLDSEEETQVEPLKSSHCPRAEKSTGYHRSSGNNKFARFLLPLTGLACLVWMLIRVVPKPSRAEYPCMKVAAPLAGGFVAYIAGMAIALFSLRKAGHLFREHRSILAVSLVLCGAAVGMFTVLKTDSESYAAILATDSLFVPGEPPNTPMGVAKGIFPGRVVWMWDSTATTWNGTSGNWWSDNSTHQDVVDSMLTKSLRSLTGKSSESAAWDTLFRYFNLKHAKGNVGYAAGEKIAIKINLVQSSFPGNIGNASFVAPQLALSVLRQLVTIAGVRTATSQSMIPTGTSRTPCTRSARPHIPECISWGGPVRTGGSSMCATRRLSIGPRTSRWRSTAAIPRTCRQL